MFAFSDHKKSLASYIEADVKIRKGFPVTFMTRAARLQLSVIREQWPFNFVLIWKVEDLTFLKVLPLTQQSKTKKLKRSKAKL